MVSRHDYHFNIRSAYIEMIMGVILYLFLFGWYGSVDGSVCEVGWVGGWWVVFIIRGRNWVVCNSFMHLTAGTRQYILASVR